MNWKQKILGFIENQSKTGLICEEILLVILVGIIDYATGYEVSFFPFYSFPILVALWFNGVIAAVFISSLSAAVWCLIDYEVGHVYTHEWLRFWDMIVRLMFFCLVVATGSAFRRQRDLTRARIELLERSHQLEQEIINISERERLTIGRDLHDSLGQHLVAIGYAADALKRDLGKGLLAIDTAHKIADSIHDAVVRARDIARGLSPVDQDEGGLESALEAFTQRVSRLTGIQCRFHADGMLQACENSRAIHIFRIAQEATNNALKHAQPNKIDIHFEIKNDGLILSIRDDGKGFQPNETSNGMGLNIMQYRANTIGGTLDIKPAAPHGTVVTCRISGPAFDLLVNRT